MRLESGNDKGDRLYRRFLDGDASALAELTGLYRESLTQFITGFIGNTSDAEELMLLKEWIPKISISTATTRLRTSTGASRSPPIG